MQRWWSGDKFGISIWLIFLCCESVLWFLNGSQLWVLFTVSVVASDNANATNHITNYKLQHVRLKFHQKKFPNCTTPRQFSSVKVRVSNVITMMIMLPLRIYTTVMALKWKLPMTSKVRTSVRPSVRLSRSWKQVNISSILSPSARHTTIPSVMALFRLGPPNWGKIATFDQHLAWNRCLMYHRVSSTFLAWRKVIDYAAAFVYHGCSDGRRYATYLFACLSFITRCLLLVNKVAY